MMKHLQILILSICAIAISSCQKTESLHFDSQGEFKIVQFTDLHWDPRSPGCEQTLSTMRLVLDAEKPALVIITGDVVTAPPAREGLEAIASFMSSTGLPWCVTMGNHDFEAEEGFTKKEIFEILAGKPGYIGSVGECASGVGNFAIEVLGHNSNKIEAVLYCIDSNDYPQDNQLGHYDWIRYDQIAWYRAKSESYKKQNGGSPVPSLAFFHIPVPEYGQIGWDNITGSTREGVSSPQVNSGFMASVLDNGDIRGIFVGHDHRNDYIGLWKGIALAYGRTTGADAEGNLERGARVVVLDQKRPGSFTTWLRSASGIEHKYYYPSGISEADELSMEYLPAVEADLTGNGLEYDYYEGGRMRSTQALEGLQPKASGRLANISLEPAVVLDSMGFVFRGLINVPERGIYRFHTFSDDGSVLMIDGRKVVDNDGSRSARRAEGMIGLDAGLHTFKLLYVEDYMSQCLEVGIASRNLPEMSIPDSMFYTGVVREGIK